MTGNSYPGTTPLMALAYGEPAIKAVAPKFADFDLYADLLMPGGVSSEALTVKWGELVRQMDLNKAPDGSSASVRPVDGPDGDTQLASAVEDHKINPWSFDRAAYEVTYKDEPLTQFGGMPIDEAGVFLLQHAAEQSRAPIFGWGSWLDSGIAQGLLNRFMNWTNPQLSIIGPWTHGARSDVNVFHPNEPLDPSRPAQEQMIYCFLSNYVSDRPEPLASHTLYYFTMGEDRWKTTHVWPLPGHAQPSGLYLAADNTLTKTAPTVAGRDTYKVDFDASAGPSNRWATQAGEPTIDYGDRAEADRNLLGVHRRAARAGPGSDRTAGHHAAGHLHTYRRQFLRLPGRCRTRWSCHLSHGRGVAGAGSPPVTRAAAIQDDVPLSHLLAGGCRAPRAWRGRDR